MRLLSRLCLGLAALFFDLAGRFEPRETDLSGVLLTEEQYRDYCRARRETLALRRDGDAYLWRENPEARA